MISVAAMRDTMVTMIPAEPRRSGGGATAEAMLFDAFKSGLRNTDWMVFSSLQLLTAATAGEGECDFVLVHPKHGLFVVECKGRGVRRNHRGDWQRRQFGHWQRTKNPMTQAQDNVKDLKRKLMDRMGGHFPDMAHFPLVTGHAVAFPRTPRRNISDTPLNWEPELLLDCNDLLNPSRWVNGMVALWKSMSDRQCAERNHTPPRGLKPEEFNAFIKKVLYPEFEIRPSFRGDIIGEKQALLRLSDEQKYVAEQILDNTRVNVLGGAGTGKTIVALETTRLLAEQDLKVLLLCYNRALANDLSEQTSAMNAKDNITATSFHGLCVTAAKALGHRGLAVPREREAAKTYWRQDAPFLIVEAVAHGHLPRFDAIVVDEGQDFLPDWWTTIEDLYADVNPRRLFVFHDPGQDIFEHGNAVPNAPVFRLTRNFRNPQKVGAHVNALSDLPTKPHERAPLGEAPTFIPLPSPSKLIRHLTERVSRLTGQGIAPEEITILTLRTQKNSPLNGVTSLGEIPIVSLRNARPGAITHSTVSAFKGLESDIIFFIEGNSDDTLATQSVRYVAASRCRHRLFVYADENWIKSTDRDADAKDK
ncbi:MAG: NERD domain-containing protein/DEAD/DEAH box helicase [Myxococcota bacterium]|nr:NERD domain-containing protein/DEAD/DEAH box helicase [Myxococcota bacterium]